MYQDKTITKEKPRLLLIVAFMVLNVSVAAIFSSCESGVNKGERGFTVAGFITDSLTKLPIDSATIWWHDTLNAPPQYALSYSDTQGHYVLGVPEGSVRMISAAKSGYVKKTVSIGVGWSSDTVRINMELATE